jgi:hypothetical protein
MVARPAQKETAGMLDVGTSRSFELARRSAAPAASVRSTTPFVSVAAIR